MRITPLAVLLLSSLPTVQAAPAPAATQPKLVVVLVVDGLPSEQLQRYRDQFGQGGLCFKVDPGHFRVNRRQWRAGAGAQQARAG